MADPVLCFSSFTTSVILLCKIFELNNWLVCLSISSFRFSPVGEISLPSSLPSFGFFFLPLQFKCPFKFFLMDLLNKSIRERTLKYFCAD